MSESYFIGGDTLFDLKEPLLIGQTFSPTKDHTLEYIDLNLKRTTIGGKVWITLHDLATDPDMVGGGISHTKKVTWAPHKPTDITRVRFSMAKQPVKINEHYGILVHSETDPWWNVHKVQYDDAQATYPMGCRFTKNGLLDPPAWYYGSDLMFAEFGPPPPEPPPYEPPIEHYAILDIKQYDTGLGIRLVVTTNVPCHLWMVWTAQEPWQHLIHGKRRGAWVVREVRFCFVDFHANEQLEPGDTLLHTFIKEPWEVCETRWFTFKGKVGDYFTTSASAIFAKHRIGPPVIPACYSYDFYLANWTFARNDREVSCSLKPCKSYLADRLTIGLCCPADSDAAEAVRFSLYDAGPDSKPIGDPLRTGVIGVDLPAPPAYHKYTLYFDPIALDLDNIYAIGVTAAPNDPGEWHDVLYVAGEDEQTCPHYGGYCHRHLVNGGWDEWEYHSGTRYFCYEIPEGL